MMFFPEAVFLRPGQFLGSPKQYFGVRGSFLPFRGDLVLSGVRFMLPWGISWRPG